MSCPCCSGKPYFSCCKKYHDGAVLPDALSLMRSRYSAYALGLFDYIIKTTHPENPTFEKDTLSWSASIVTFSHETTFEFLEIIDFTDGEQEAFVRFTAHLSQGGHDASFTERSRFLKVDGRWLYRDGVVSMSRA